jgi:mannose-1-phosphate guanylyltransferase/mannose-6-phosphate isomerase
MNEKIVPVLLAGGSGKRLWPLSRKSYPKQFSNLIGDASLFQQSAMRLTSSNIIHFSPHITVTNSDFRFIVCQQLQEVGIDPGTILIEPEAKNTAPAILAACLLASKIDEDAILLVAPSDHLIDNVDAFHKVLAEAISLVKEAKIVTFGITPSRPETGYGYLEISKLPQSSGFAVTQFVEKPNAENAQAMIDSDNYLWNAGIFMFRAKNMIAAFKEHNSFNLKLVRTALQKAKPDLGFMRLDSEAWTKCENISIDHAIMERAKNLVTIPFSGGWSDLGGWDAIWRAMGPDENGVAMSKNAHNFECKNTLLRSENAGQEIVGLGLNDIIAIAMPDAVLVAHKDQAQNVKSVVAKLKSQTVAQAETFPKDHRPWGWFETLAIRDRFQVKRILVNPGAALSLQSHNHRSEHWIVVEGTAKIILNDTEKLLTEGESIYIPLGAVHRMENPGKVPMVLIEIQTGAYLGEDDIIRYEDIYARGNT